MIVEQSLECGDPAPLWILDKSPKAGQIYKSGEKTNTPEAYKSSAGVPQSNPPLADKSQAGAPDKETNSDADGQVRVGVFYLNILEYMLLLR